MFSELGNSALERSSSSRWQDLAWLARAAPPPTALDRRDFETGKSLKTKHTAARILCPICRWQPPKSAMWYCAPMGAPEHFTGGCGHGWHTFDTRGKCPGCTYQWKHTTCHRCGATSVHDDWYEPKGKTSD